MDAVRHACTSTTWVLFVWWVLATSNINEKSGWCSWVSFDAVYYPIPLVACVLHDHKWWQDWWSLGYYCVKHLRNLTAVRIGDPLASCLIMNDDVTVLIPRKLTVDILLVCRFLGTFQYYWYQGKQPRFDVASHSKHLFDNCVLSSLREIMKHIRDELVLEE